MGEMNFISILGGCANVSCDWNALCRPDSAGGHVCKCPESCNDVINAPWARHPEAFDDSAPNSTVDNRQRLQPALHWSPAQIASFTGVKVCGTDGLTHESECQMRMTSCKGQVHLAVASIGECGELTYFSILRRTYVPYVQCDFPVAYYTL